MADGVAVIAAGDFNNDGYGDLALIHGNEVDIYLGNGSGFRGPVTYEAGVNPAAIVVRDLNGDGKRDLVIANHGSDDVSVLRGKGDGTFEPAQHSPRARRPPA
jgi:FG-GAP-like repeat